MGDLRAWLPEAEEEEDEEEEEEEETEAETWGIAEAATQEILEKVQPTTVSELRRKAVIHYVHSLITRSTASQVFPFGSVPLKTYLPDGDIDLTAVSGKNFVEEHLATEVYSALQRQDQNCAAEFVVKDVQLIRAEVKLVKCLVQNIVVDISFNQLGGLSTLCFLEKVDLLIGKDHLFKRSIILVKAWCYYESRILGAHHGLISTYALETLVLYIFHVFHSSLNGPLAALYKFLDYFSKFDWDNYCISLNGPVRLVSLPELVVETPENGGYDLLLSDDFFKECVETFSVPARGYDTNSRTFCPKHLNIVDPLKGNNNLGRSVSKGNFYRIKSAFMHGARKLGCILSLPEETVANELRKFFSNTLDRHGSGERPDVQDAIPSDNQYGSVAALTFSGRELDQQDQFLNESESAILRGRSGESAHLTSKKSGEVSNFGRMATEEANFTNGLAVSETCLNGDANLATFGSQGLSNSNDNVESCTSGVEPSKSPRVNEFNVTHFFFSHSTMEDGDVGNGNTQCGSPSSNGFTEMRLSSQVLPALGEEMTHVECTDVDDNQLFTDNESLFHCGSKKHPLYLNSLTQSFKDGYRSYYDSQALITAAGSPEPFYTLADLSGDYNSHLNNLHYGRSYYEHSPRKNVRTMSQAFTAQSQAQNSWDVMGQPMHFRKDVIPPLNSNVVQSSQLHSYGRHLPSGAAFFADEMTKPRGTGTYFPNTNHYLNRVSNTRVRNQGPMRFPHGNGRIVTSQETTLPETNGCDQLQTQVPYHRNGRKSQSFDHRKSRSPEAESNSHVNNTVHLWERVVVFRTLGQVPPGMVSVESSKQPMVGSVTAENSCVSLPTRGAQSSKPFSPLEQDRIDGQSYKLKDDEDFPPLCDSNAKGLSSIYVVKNREC